MNYLSKHSLLFILTFVLLAVSQPAYGQVGLEMKVEATATTTTAIPSHTPIWTDYNDSDPGISDDPDKPVVTGVLPNATPAKESGEKSGTEDINIGVGELQETQHDQSDLEFLSERASAVAVSAVEVRGWDQKKKEAHLAAVKSEAEIHSGQDLESFAQGVLLKHEEIESIETNKESITIKSSVPARFLGIFKTTLEQETTITFGDGEHGRVKVRFPWVRLLFSVDENYQEEGLKAKLLPEIEDEVLVGVKVDTDLTPAMQAKIITHIATAVTTE